MAGDLLSQDPTGGARTHTDLPIIPRPALEGKCGPRAVGLSPTVFGSAADDVAGGVRSDAEVDGDLFVGTALRPPGQDAAHGFRGLPVHYADSDGSMKIVLSQSGCCRYFQLSGS